VETKAENSVLRDWMIERGLLQRNGGAPAELSDAFARAVAIEYAVAYLAKRLTEGDTNVRPALGQYRRRLDERLADLVAVASGHRSDAREDWEP
jgi:hypothetical protein